MKNERLNEIRKSFKKYFGDTEYSELPEELIVGKVEEMDHLPQVGGVWFVKYKLCFENGEYYLDFFASHRQTNSRHARILENGEIKSLENYWEFGYVIYKDDPERTEKERNEMIEKNRKVSEILKRKGFE